MDALQFYNNNINFMVCASQLLVEESSRRGKEKKRTKRKRDKDNQRLLMIQGLGGVLGNVPMSNSTAAGTAGMPSAAAIIAASPHIKGGPSNNPATLTSHPGKDLRYLCTQRGKPVGQQLPHQTTDDYSDGELYQDQKKRRKFH